jgi:curli biogenesis system outer membrane secretion channel CsgG
MKSILVSLCVFLLSAAAWTSDAAAQSGDRKPRIAIIDFDYATVHSAVSAIFGTNVDVGKGIGDLLVTHLVKDGTYSVIERAALDRILAEQNFSNSDRADPSSAAKIGRLLGVDAILVGSITQFGNDTRSTGVGGVGAAAGRLGLGGVRQKQSKAIVGLNARLVNVDTGEILAAAESLGESKRTSTSLAGGGGSWRGFGAGGVDFGSSDFQNTIIGEAVKEAVEEMTRSVVSERGRVQARHVPVQGLVAAVSGSQIVLNVGTGAGVKVGDQLNVERITSEIKDPESGKVIRRMTSKVGVVRVVDVDEQSAVAEVVSGSEFQVSDVVRSAPNQP